MKREGRMGWSEGGGALVWMGGPEAYESTVEGCRIEDPRGWTGVSRYTRFFVVIAQFSLTTLKLPHDDTIFSSDAQSISPWTRS